MGYIKCLEADYEENTNNIAAFPLKENDQHDICVSSWCNKPEQQSGKLLWILIPKYLQNPKETILNLALCLMHHKWVQIKDNSGSAFTKNLCKSHSIANSFFQSLRIWSKILRTQVCLAISVLLGTSSVHFALMLLQVCLQTFKFSNKF